MTNTINTSTSTNFDFTTIDSALVLHGKYSDSVKKAVAEFNSAQVQSDLGQRYPKVAVKTLDGRITALKYSAQGQYANLPEAVVKYLDEFFAKAESEEQFTLSRNKVHKLLIAVNEMLPENQRIKLTSEVELGLIECLIGRKLVGHKFARNIKDICKVITRTYFAALNGKELSVVYKGL